MIDAVCVERLVKMLRPSWFEYVYVDEATGEERHGLNNYPGQHKQMQQRAAREEAREFLASLADAPASPARVEQAAWWCCDTSCKPSDKPCANCIDRVNAILEIVSGEQPIQSAAPASPSPAPHTPTVEAWRCYHCDKMFTDRAEAEEHFGRFDDCLPACKIGVEQFRKMEAELQDWRSQNDPATKEFYSLGADHDRKVGRAEQEGYDKGLADGRASDTALHAPTVEACIEELRRAHEEAFTELDREQSVGGGAAGGTIAANWHGGKVNGLATALDRLRALTSGAEAGERPVPTNAEPTADAGEVERLPWRIGRHFPIHIYEGDVPIATAQVAAYAKQIVADHNAVLRPASSEEQVERAIAAAHKALTDAGFEREETHNNSGWEIAVRAILASAEARPGERG